MGTELAFAVHGDVTSVYEAVPKPGTVPAVIVLHARWGFERYMPAICDRLAFEGFIVQAPDLYQGVIAKNDEEAEALLKGIDLPRVEKVVAACIASLTDHIKSHRSKVGVIGIGMGGQIGLHLASKFPQIAACADIYGMRPSFRFLDQSIPCPTIAMRADIPRLRKEGDAGLDAGTWSKVVTFLRDNLAPRPLN